MIFLSLILSVFPMAEERVPLSAHDLGVKGDSAPLPEIQSEPIEVALPNFSSGREENIVDAGRDLLGKIPAPKNPALTHLLGDQVMPAAKIHELDYISGGLYTAGGFDTKGGISRMRGTLRSIPQGDVYAFLVAVETVSPLIGSAIKQVESWSNQINSSHIIASEVAVASLPGMGPKNARASRMLCEQIKSQEMDWIEAKHACRDSKVRQEAIKAAKNHGWILAGDYNMARELAPIDPIRGMYSLGSDSIHEQLPVGLRHICLNLLGTIVVREGRSIEVYPPRHREMIALLHSGKTCSGYEFIGDDGEDVRSTSLSLQQATSEKTRVLALLKGIQAKLLDEKDDLTEEEQQLLQSARLPVGSMIVLLTQYKGSGSAIALERMADLLAFDRVMNWAEEIVRDSLTRTEAWRAVQTNSSALDEYIKQVQFVYEDLQVMKQDHGRQMFEEARAFESMIELENRMRDRI